MAIPIRSQLSARLHKRTLFVVQARDEYVSYLDTEHRTLDFTQQTVRQGLGAFLWRLHWNLARF